MKTLRDSNKAFIFTPQLETQDTLMVEENTPESESQKAPYVKPKILTLKVDLSFASSATDLEDDIIDSLGPQPTKPAIVETPPKASNAAVGGRNRLLPSP